MLALATLANILSYADTLLLADTVVVEALGAGVPILVETVRQAQTADQRPQRFYALAALANASAHPRLCALINQNGGE